MNRATFHIAILFLNLALSACEDESVRLKQEKNLINSRLQERLDMARNLRIEECDRKLLDSALYIVDSIRVLEAKWALDTFNRPYKPYKPEHPGPGVSIESLLIKPLLPDSTIK